MKLFYDLRLGYFVSAPGQETPVSTLAGKAGDGDEVVIQFGRSSDPTGSASIVTAQTWTAENLSGGTVIKVGLKELGEYSDGVLLSSNPTWTHDSGAKTYTGALSYNTTQINTAIARGDDNPENSIPQLDCTFEVTFQPGGSGAWRSSIYPIDFTLYHDVLYGDEATPSDAATPSEYLLKASGIEWLPTITSKTGGTSADLDSVPTVAVTAGKIVMFKDADSSDVLRYYQLTAGTDAESSPTVIRPDDYNASTNAKVWMQRQVDGDLLLPSAMSQAEAETGTSTTSRLISADVLKAAVIEHQDPTVSQPPNGLSSSVANEVVLFNGTDGKQLKRATTTGLAKLTSGVLSAATAGTDYANVGAVTSSGLTISTGKLAGRTTASTGALEEITPSTGLNLSGGVLTADTVPSGVVTLTTDTNLIVGTHNKQYVECTGAMTTVTISRQLDSTWTDNAFFWIANRLSSGSITIARGSGVSLLLTNTSADFTLTSGSRPVKIWRSAENVWRVIS